MDFRGIKVFDFVSVSRNMTVNVNKNKISQMKWQNDYQWLCNKYRLLEKKLNNISNNKHANKTNNTTKEDRRTCLSFPQTTNRNYGWLSQRAEFELEKYGNFIVKHYNPMDEIYFLGGNIPTIAGGKGHI